MRNLQEQVKKAFCYQKLFWPCTVWINCSSDLKYFENSRPSASNFKSFSRSLEQFFLTIGQNNSGNKIPFLVASLSKLTFSAVIIAVSVGSNSTSNLVTPNMRLLYSILGMYYFLGRINFSLLCQKVTSLVDWSGFNLSRIFPIKSWTMKKEGGFL